MNISYVTNDFKSHERHMLEHLVLYRTKNYPEATSFYNFLNKNNVTLDLYSRYDFMEVTFLNVNSEIEKIIDTEFLDWYFTIEDFELEKRVINIEMVNQDSSQWDSHTNCFLDNIKYTPPFDLEYFKNVNYEDLLLLKEKVIFKKVVFDEKRYTDINLFDLKDFKIKEKVERDDFIIFSFENDIRLRELFILIAIALDGSGYFVQRHNNFTEQSLAFKNREFTLFKDKISHIMVDKYDEVILSYNNLFESNSVDWTAFDFVNIDDKCTKDEKIKMILNIFKIMN